MHDNELSYREDRYLLFLTENYTALQTLQHFLTSIQSDGLDTSNSTVLEPYILFGSSFPKDKEYTQVCILVVTNENCGIKYYPIDV